MLLVVPLLSLIGLWGFAASVTLGAALNKFQVATTYDKIGGPGAALSIQLQLERTLSAPVARSHGQYGTDVLNVQREHTDQARAAFLKSVQSPDVQNAATPAIRQRLAAFVSQLNTLSGTRGDVDTGRIDALQAINDYNGPVEASYRLFESLSIINDLSIFKQGGGLVTMSWSREYMLREDALIESIPLASEGRMSLPEYATFVGWVTAGRHEFDIAMSNLEGNVGEPFREMAQSRDYQSLRSVEDAIAAGKPGAKQLAVFDWRSAAGPLLNDWGQATGAAGQKLASQAKPVGDRIVLQLIAAGVLGLAAVAASIVISVVFVRRISEELGGLQQAARMLAEERLPNVVQRLRRGEDVDVATEAPPISIGRTAEVVRVAEAFNAVQHTAIESAVGESYLRKGISRVFLNLAWRSQSLLHRQLRMLDTMERKATDPEELEDLFRLDHLTTRMRRHAEGLVILSGAPAGRGWNQPVSMDDVLRGAVAEVEDYTRVDTVLASTAALTGSVVADVIHLLAELIENATAFSPPPTEVQVRGELVGSGFAIEVIDRGIGLGHDEMAELNLRLSRPPEFDLADSDRLGLFVVARLAARHSIKVTLQTSAYGGTTAVVLIPRDLIVLDDVTESTDRPQQQLNAPAAITMARQDSGRSGDSREWFEPSQIARTPGMTASEPPAAPAHPVYEHRTPTGEFGPAAGPVTTQVPAAPATVEGTLMDDSEGDDLPRRVRQANLVPQLRRKAASSAGGGNGVNGASGSEGATNGTAYLGGGNAGQAATDFSEDDDDRPEQSRNLMTSLQSGWLLGRSSDDGDDGIPFERRNEWGES